MKIEIVAHEAEEGGFWAEVPAIPGCATNEACAFALQTPKTKREKTS
jgi:hypothetical protein